MMGDNSLRLEEEASDINNVSLSDEQTNNAKESKSSFIKDKSRSWSGIITSILSASIHVVYIGITKLAKLTRVLNIFSNKSQTF